MSFRDAHSPSPSSASSFNLAFDDVSVFGLDLAKRERLLDLGDLRQPSLFVDHDHVAAKLQN
jgi:hypothetical protein